MVSFGAAERSIDVDIWKEDERRPKWKNCGGFLQKAYLIMINCGGFFAKKVRVFLEKLCLFVVVFFFVKMWVRLLWFCLLSVRWTCTHFFVKDYFWTHLVGIGPHQLVLQTITGMQKQIQQMLQLNLQLRTAISQPMYLLWYNALRLTALKPGLSLF